MSNISGAQFLAESFEAYGVTHVFFVPTILSRTLVELEQRTGIKRIMAHSEKPAAYMADGYARVSGRVGVCEGPSGGGATYILPGLVEANESSIPILAITSDISVSGRGRYTLTELDQQAVMRPLTKWNCVVDQGAALPRAVRAAFRAMTTGKPGSAHIGVPLDVQRQPVDGDDVWASMEHGRYPAEPVAPDAAAIDRAAQILCAARSPLFVCGGGVVIAGAEAALAESSATAANATQWDATTAIAYWPPNRMLAPPDAAPANVSSTSFGSTSLRKPKLSPPLKSSPLGSLPSIATSIW